MPLNMKINKCDMNGDGNLAPGARIYSVISRTNANIYNAGRKILVNQNNKGEE